MNMVKETKGMKKKLRFGVIAVAERENGNRAKGGKQFLLIALDK